MCRLRIEPEKAQHPKSHQYSDCGYGLDQCVRLPLVVEHSAQRRAPTAAETPREGARERERGRGRLGGRGREREREGGREHEQEREKERERERERATPLPPRPRVRVRVRAISGRLTFTLRRHKFSLWCFGALYSTHAAPQESRDKLRVSAPTRPPLIVEHAAQRRATTAAETPHARGREGEEEGADEGEGTTYGEGARWRFGALYKSASDPPWW